MLEPTISPIRRPSSIEPALPGFMASILTPSVERNVEPVTAGGSNRSPGNCRSPRWCSVWSWRSVRVTVGSYIWSLLGLPERSAGRPTRAQMEAEQDHA